MEVPCDLVFGGDGFDGLGDGLDVFGDGDSGGVSEADLVGAEVEKGLGDLGDFGGGDGPGEGALDDGGDVGSDMDLEVGF